MIIFFEMPIIFHHLLVQKCYVFVHYFSPRNFQVALINTHLLRNSHVNSVPTFQVVERKQWEDLHGRNIRENPTSQLLPAIGTAPHNLSPPIHHPDLSEECGRALQPDCLDLHLRVPTCNILGRSLPLWKPRFAELYSASSQCLCLTRASLIS